MEIRALLSSSVQPQTEVPIPRQEPARAWLCPKPIMCGRRSCQQQPLRRLPAPNQIKPTEPPGPCRLCQGN